MFALSGICVFMLSDVVVYAGVINSVGLMSVERR